MRYVNLDNPSHGGSIEGARVILGCVAAAGPDVVTFRSATGSLHSVPAYGGDCAPGKYAIAGQIEIWGILGVFDDAEKALAELPEALRRVAQGNSPAKERRLHEEALAGSEPAATSVETKIKAELEGLSRAHAELAAKPDAAATDAVKLMDREAAVGEEPPAARPVSKSVEKRQAAQRGTEKKSDG
jgi:hypothetical protein